MKSIHATLASAQQAARDPAIARASLADNGHLHPELFTDKGSAGEPSVACLHGSTIVRIRRPIAGGFDFQVIADPATAANWTSGWTSFSISNVSTNSLAIFSTGTYVVAVWQDSSDLDLKYSRSATGAAGTWSAAAVAYSLASAASPTGVTDTGAAHCGIFFWHSNDIKWGAYDPVGDSWAAASAAGLTATLGSSIGAAWDAANSRHLILFIYNGALTGAYTPLACMTRSAAGSWSTPRLILLGATSNTSDQGGLSLSQSQYNGFWYLAFWRYKTWATTNRLYLARSDDGEYWQDPIALPGVVHSTGTQAKTELIGALGGYTWLADERYVFRAVPQTFWSNQRLRSYELNTRSPVNPLPPRAAVGSVGQGGVQGSTLTLEVDESSAALTDPELFSVLTLERGYNVSATDYYQSAGAFHVTAYEHILQDNLLRLYCVDAAGLLFHWTADQVHRWAGETLQTLVTLVCALAGVHSVTFDSNTLWSDTVSLFSVNPGLTGYNAIQSLAQRAGFNLRATEAGALYFYIPTASPSADHTYGPSDHLHWPGRFGRAAAANFVQVLGSTTTYSAESHDTAAQSLAGRRLSSSLYDQRIASAADAAQLATPRLVHAQEASYFHDLTAPPNFALELGDALEVLDGGFGEDNGPWRCAGCDEYYNPASLKQKFFQRIYLRGTT